MTVPDLAKKISHKIDRNSPAILLGVSLAGLLVTVYLTHRATKKAEAKITVAETEEGRRLTGKEKLALTWTTYIPPALSCGTTLIGIVAGNTVQYKRYAALGTALSLSETALTEYRQKAMEVAGKTKDIKIRDALVQDKITEKEKSGDFDLLRAPNVDNQEQYVYETITGRLLISTPEKLHRAANAVARDCINHDGATLNSFYRKIGLAEVPMGDELGWNNDYPLELDLASAIVHEGKGMIAINYTYQPTVGYDAPFRSTRR